MTTLTVNGRPITLDAPPRTSLADALRDHLLLTGTHTGCEHGVCGACTVLLDNQPVRACIAYLALCDGADVRTIEGLDDDPVATRLRAAFTAEHALQCGYCTPGMLVTARDIVHRLPGADDDCIRLELAGNLCRCTGYDGIVRAIRRVLNEHLVPPPAILPPIPARQFGGANVEPRRTKAPQPEGLNQRLRFDVPAETLWKALQDPAAIAESIPGASLTHVDGDTIAGAMRATFGPVRVTFEGKATLRYDQPNRSGTIEGGGQDGQSGTRVTAIVRFQVEEQGPTASLLAIDIDYGLRGPLARLVKGRTAALLAADLAAVFGTNLAARLRGETAAEPIPLGGGALLWRLLRAWWAGSRRPK